MAFWALIPSWVFARSGLLAAAVWVLEVCGLGGMVHSVHHVSATAAVLCCAALRCTALRCTALRCAALCSTAAHGHAFQARQGAGSVLASMQQAALGKCVRWRVRGAERVTVLLCVYSWGATTSICAPYTLSYTGVRSTLHRGGMWHVCVGPTIVQCKWPLLPTCVA
jgi:hypothetical protein